MGVIMAVYEFLRDCPASYDACWSQEHRYYRMRQNHILAIATHLFGSRVHAHQWLCQKAFGLNHSSPCSFLSSCYGYVVVRNFLMRVQYGVYC
ncbi:MbcA/ParS/Xre antitoxin family protein [Pseudomonas moraviensis]|uniref:MbcA/ParS/Xre antitoxin family protein n=1 Tax=Pseudomonas moraviensis TaxID=321662 RepID=UPI0033A8683D